MLCKAPIKPVIAIINAVIADKAFTKTFVTFIKACFFMVLPHLESSYDSAAQPPDFGGRALAVT